MPFMLPEFVSHHKPLINIHVFGNHNHDFSLNFTIIYLPCGETGPILMFLSGNMVEVGDDKLLDEHLDSLPSEVAANLSDVLQKEWAIAAMFSENNSSSFRVTLVPDCLSWHHYSTVNVNKVVFVLASCSLKEHKVKHGQAEL